MTFEEFAKAAEGFTFGWPLKDWGARAGVARSPHTDLVCIYIWLDAPHRDSGERGLGGVTQRHFIDELAIASLTEETVRAFIRRTAQQLMMHELDESILVNGERVYDPHVAK